MSSTYMPSPTQEQIDYCAANLQFTTGYITEQLSELPTEKQNFAVGLCGGYKKQGSVSSKQLYWIAMFFFYLQNKLHGPGIPGEQDTSARGTTPKELPVNAALLMRLIDTGFNKGRLLYPTIRLHLRAAEIVILNCDMLHIRRGGVASKNPGHIWVTARNDSNEGSFLCRITPSGDVIWNTHLWYNMPQQQLIKRLLEAPITEILTRGKELGECCFCGKELENASSVQHGYGPICAANFGLPWGEVEPPKLEEIL